MALPLVPVLKLIALGMIKFVVLGVGALIVPILTVRFVLGGTGESIRLTTQWMVDNDKMNQQEADVFLSSLSKVQEADFTRAQARDLLFSMLRKAAAGAVTSTTGMFQRILTDICQIECWCKVSRR